MSNDERFHAPAPVVTEREPVHVAPQPLEGDVPTVDPILFFAV